jgi:hypothetical protein
MAGDWTPEPFEADDGTIPFARFVDELSDFKFVALDTAIDRVLSVRGIDLVRTEWLKALAKASTSSECATTPPRLPACSEARRPNS